MDFCPIYSKILPWMSEFFWIFCGFVEIFAASPIFKRCEEYKIGKYLLPGMFDLIQKWWPCLSRKTILYVMICGVWRCQPCVSWYQPISHPLFWIFLDNYLNVVGICWIFSVMFENFCHFWTHFWPIVVWFPAAYGSKNGSKNGSKTHSPFLDTHIPYGSLRS